MSLSVPWQRGWICRAEGIFTHILPQEITPVRVFVDGGWGKPFEALAQNFENVGLN